MDQYQQYPGSPQGNNSNPYDFILNPEKQPKKTLFGKGSGGNNNLAKMAAIIAGVAIVVMIVLTLALNMLVPTKVNTAGLTSLAQSQTEIQRVSQLAVTGAVQQVTKNLATTIVFTMITQQKQTLEVLAENGTKVGAKQLVLKQDAATDQKLTAAKTTSTYDQAYIELAEKGLNDYAELLKSMTDETSSPTIRDQLSSYYRQTQLLISQIPYAQDNAEGNTTPSVAQ